MQAKKTQKKLLVLLAALLIVGSLDARASLLLHYRFNKVDGQWVHNETGNQGTGTIQGVPGYVPGFEQQGLLLANHGDYIGAPDNLNTALKSFTFMTWVKLDALKSSTRFFDWGSGSNDSHPFMAFIPSYGMDNGMMALRFRSATGQIKMAFSNRRCPVGVWTHVALTYSWDETLKQGSAAFFINGEPAGESTRIPYRPDEFLGNTSDNFFGHSRYDTDTNGFGGAVDELKLFSRALSRDDIREEAGLKGLQGDLLIHHNFGESSDDQVSGKSLFKLKASLKNNAQIVTLGDASSGYFNVLSFGENNGYLDMGEAAGQQLAQCKDYTLSAFFRIEENYNRLQQDGNILWNFSNSLNTATDQSGFLSASLKDQSAGLSPATNTPASGFQKVAFNQPALQGDWHHLAYTQEGQTGTLYIDGVEVARESISNSIASSLLKNAPSGTTFNWLGRSAFFSESYLQSTMIYDFRLYRKALSEEEIAHSVLKVDETIALLQRATAANIADEKVAESTIWTGQEKPRASHMLTSTLNNTETSTALAQLNEITFANNSLFINLTSGSNLEFPLNEIRKITFGGITTSITGAEMKEDLQLYPNPAISHFSLSPIPHKGLKVSIYNISGQLVLEQELSPEKANVNIQSLPKGWYLVKTTSGSHKLLKL